MPNSVKATESLTPAQQYVWGKRYVDDLVLRDRDTTADGTLDERLYSLADPNFNVVALAESDGDLVERYTYTAYGTPKVRDASFSIDAFCRAENVLRCSFAIESFFTSGFANPNPMECQFQPRQNRAGKWLNSLRLRKAAANKVLCARSSESAHHTLVKLFRV